MYDPFANGLKPLQITPLNAFPPVHLLVCFRDCGIVMLPENATDNTGRMRGRTQRRLWRRVRGRSQKHHREAPRGRLARVVCTAAQTTHRPGHLAWPISTAGVRTVDAFLEADGGRTGRSTLERHFVTADVQDVPVPAITTCRGRCSVINQLAICAHALVTHRANSGARRVSVEEAITAGVYTTRRKRRSPV